jgi:hypothetical protein
MAGGKCRCAKLKLFSGKQACLNRLIIKLLKSSKTPLTKFEIYKIIHGMKGCRHFASGTVYRRINVLIDEKCLVQVGCKPGKVQGESALYILTKRGKANLLGDEKSIQEFLETATDEKLSDFIDLWE